MGNKDYLSGGCDMGWYADLSEKLCYEKFDKKKKKEKKKKENDHLIMPENLNKNLEQKSYTECVTHEIYYSTFPAHPSPLYPSPEPRPPPSPKN